MPDAPLTGPAPTPCPNCGGRDITMPRPTVAEMFTEAFNAQPFPAVFCAGCGIERADLYPSPEDATP